MKASEFVRIEYPQARAIKQINGRIKGLQSVFYYIKDGGDPAPSNLGQGKTESAAWADAKSNISKNSNKLNT